MDDNDMDTTTAIGTGCTVINRQTDWMLTVTNRAHHTDSSSTTDTDIGIGIGIATRQQGRMIVMESNEQTNNNNYQDEMMEIINRIGHKLSHRNKDMQEMQMTLEDEVLGKLNHIEESLTKGAKSVQNFNQKLEDKAEELNNRAERIKEKNKNNKNEK